MPQQRPAPTARSADRMAFIDGLRGVAIAMVLIFHSWGNLGLPAPRNAVEFFAAQGFQGVSLFFVISGLCLSLPVWKRRKSGNRQWFIPSEFFTRRVLRILPPYYAALVLFSLVKIIASHHQTLVLSSREAPLTVTDVLYHVFLIHNLTPYINSINGMFWSLGLEWQWYWVFPLLFVLCIRSSVISLVGCLGLTVIWHLGTGDLWGVGALPPRLFEFCCGILAARLITDRRSLSLPLLVGGVVLPLVIIETVQISLIPGLSWLVTYFSLLQPLFGVSFASLILLGHYSKVVNAVLSWRPLTGLGIASYSVYLVHGPILTRLYLLAPESLKQSMVIVPIALVLGVASGVIFHVAIERPCMRRSTWERVTPTLSRLFLWTDYLWYRFVDPARDSSAAPTPVPAVVPHVG